MNRKTTLGIVISIGLIAGLASASGGGSVAPLGDPPKPAPSGSAAPKEKPKPKPEQPKKPVEGGW